MQFIQAKNFTKGPRRAAPTLIVIHDMEAPEKPGTAEAVAKWFAGETAPKASAHFCSDDGSIVQCVSLSDIAWGAPGANSDGIHIEHAGFARQTPEEWADQYSSAMLYWSALLAGRLGRHFGIPARRVTAEELAAAKAFSVSGICGHVDVTNGRCGGKGHTDPGPNFPWDRYIETAAAAAAAEFVALPDDPSWHKSFQEAVR